MKSITRKLSNLCLASVAILSSILLLPQSAFALTEQEILEKLNNIPVFLIVNSAGQSLTASVDNEETEADLQVPIVFINPAEAEVFLEREQEEESEFVAEARIAVLTLSDVYSEASTQLEDINTLVYIPSSEAVNQASALLDREIQGVPLFAAINLESEQYLLTSDNTLPMFFSLQDLQSQLSPLLESNPDIEDSIGVEVVSFETILRTMASDDPQLDQFLELIQFVPASRTLEYIQSLPAGDAAPSGVAPSDEPAE